MRKRAEKILHSREIVILSVIFYRTKFEDLVSITHTKSKILNRSEL